MSSNLEGKSSEEVLSLLDKALFEEELKAVCQAIVKGEGNVTAHEILAVLEANITDDTEKKENSAQLRLDKARRQHRVLKEEIDFQEMMSSGSSNISTLPRRELPPEPVIDRKAQLEFFSALTFNERLSSIDFLKFLIESPDNLNIYSGSGNMNQWLDPISFKRITLPAIARALNMNRKGQGYLTAVEKKRLSQIIFGIEATNAVKLPLKERLDKELCKSLIGHIQAIAIENPSSKYSYKDPTSGESVSLILIGKALGIKCHSFPSRKQRIAIARALFGDEDTDAYLAKL